MSSLQTDNFDDYGTGGALNPAGLLTSRYLAASEASFSIVAGANFYGMDFGTAGITKYIQSSALTTVDTVIIGFSAKFDVLPASYTFFATHEGATQNVKFALLNTGEIAVYNGATLLGTTSGAGISTGTWYFIEAKVKTNNTTGTVEVHVNGNSVLSLTGKDTRNGLHDYSNEFKINSILGTHFLIDNLYFFDTSGGSENDFTGPPVSSDSTIDLLVLQLTV